MRNDPEMKILLAQTDIQEKPSDLLTEQKTLVIENTRNVAKFVGY